MLFIRDLKYKVLLVVTLGSILVIGLAFLYFSLFSAPQKTGELEQFTIPTSTEKDHNKKNIDDSREIAELLKEKRFIKSTLGFHIAFSWRISSRCVDCIQSGAYKLSKSMTVFEVANVLKKEPYMKWVVIPEGWRKEQIAELLADTLGWTDQEKSNWVNTHTSMKFDEVEGVYFPDTYLIPTDEESLQVANRLRSKFNEVFAPYLAETNKQNIKWTTLLKIASLVQREAAGKDDMSLIAGIIWNRLLNDQKLDIDATVQYARDTRLAYKDDPCEDPDSYARNTENDICFNPEMLQPKVEYRGIDDWWTLIGGSDTRSIDSLYNTYIYKGLPPHPINNPGIAAIEAVLYPEATDCFYYLHDGEGKIHCSVTLEEHEANVEQYLR
ncbi:endolytic transglycosylase MltG [Candidatus Wolfebacteria bacterium]|nr:endolytic transglycosylase MltG [Candidatus Wolfebacteria bacterium]